MRLKAYVWSALACLLAGVTGAAAGAWAVLHFTMHSHRDNQVVRAGELIAVLQAARSDDEQAALHLLDTSLDVTVIAIAAEYDAMSEQQQRAARETVRSAAAYRSEHGVTNSSRRVEAELQRAITQVMAK